MKRAMWKAPILAVVVFAIMSATGCEGQNAHNIKRSRLIANENRQLKDQLEQIEKRLEKCQQEKKAMQERAGEEASTPTEFVIGENQRLTKENEELKAQIEQLEEELQGLKEPANP
jgi:peptidoglycan hydrolase CwlO-like protein